MAGLILGGTTSGTVTLDPPAVAGSTVITLPATSGTMITTTGGVAPGTSGNLLTSNGTAWTSAAAPAGSQWTTSGSDIYYNAGNVGIGTSTPDALFHVYKTSGKVASFGNNINNNGNYVALLGSVSNKNWVISNNMIYGGEFGIGRTSSAGGTTINTTHDFQINSNGQAVIGQSAAVSAGWLTLNYDGQNYNGLMTRTTTSGTYYGAMFKNVSDAFVGNISVSASATAYNTSSDYRLKDNVAPMTGALARVALLKPVTYSWKIDGSDGEGFIAHELQEVCPLAVTGDKDAVFEDGSVKAQSIDVSFLVATLTAAIQEQQALIENLTSRLSALENK